MRRNLIIAGCVTTAIAVTAGAVAYKVFSRKPYNYPGTRLMADLGKPDALIRTTSLSALPRDLLKAPIARDVLTEDLVFYYEQNEDRLGLSGAIKRIAYEHKLGWSDRILASALDEPAEVALWRDGKGALRHYAIVMKRNTLAKMLSEAAGLALKDGQLKTAGEIGSAKLYALTLNPRRTLLIAVEGDRMVVLSDPGLLLNNGNKMLSAARDAIAGWLGNDGALAKQFALDQYAGSTQTKASHTLAIGAPTLALGYGSFLPGFKGLRLDFSQAWSTSVWLDPHGLPARGLGDAKLWAAAPANPSACAIVPVDWNAAQKVLAEAPEKTGLPNKSAVAPFDGPALACWYGESNLYSPVFIARMADGVSEADRNAAVQSLAKWALPATPAEDSKTSSGTTTADAIVESKVAKGKVKKSKTAARTLTPTLKSQGQYAVFSPDPKLVKLVLATLARTNPSVADQMPVTNSTLMQVTPSRLAPMAESEVSQALAGDTNLSDAAQTHLPKRMKALAGYPPYRLELAAPLPSNGKPAAGWQQVQWRTPGEGK
jgi:uncharacterized protein YfaA (DUF2138 family)